MFEHLLPRSPATVQDVADYLALHQAAQDFRLEVEHRAQAEAYCQWYYRTAAENRQALEQMRSEANWFGGWMRLSRHSENTCPEPPSVFGE